MMQVDSDDWEFEDFFNSASTIHYYNKSMALTHNEVCYFSIKIASVHHGSVFVAGFTEALCDLQKYGNNSRTCERKKLTKLFGCSVPHRGTEARGLGRV